jgi:hypothetical protein
MFWMVYGNKAISWFMFEWHHRFKSSDKSLQDNLQSIWQNKDKDSVRQVLEVVQSDYRQMVEMIAVILSNYEA